MAIVVVVLLAAAAGIGGGAAVIAYGSSCDLDSLQSVNIGSNTFVYAADGSLLGSIPAERNRDERQPEAESPAGPHNPAPHERRRRDQAEREDPRAEEGLAVLLKPNASRLSMALYTSSAT
jgi:hypothetical protein